MFKTRSAKIDETESIEPLPGGAAVAVARWAFGGFRAPDGEMRPPGKDRMSLIFVPRGDGLAIAHGANVRDGSVDLHSPARLLSGASAGFMPLREAVG
jgi:hypothetical protein